MLNKSDPIWNIINGNKNPKKYLLLDFDPIFRVCTLSNEVEDTPLQQFIIE